MAIVRIADNMAGIAELMQSGLESASKRASDQQILENLRADLAKLRQEVNDLKDQVRLLLQASDQQVGAPVVDAREAEHAESAAPELTQPTTDELADWANLMAETGGELALPNEDERASESGKTEFAQRALDPHGVSFDRWAALIKALRPVIDGKPWEWPAAWA